jgi:hypothetical protein
MGPLRYLVRSNGSAWRWEVLGPDGRTVASGTTGQSSVDARVDALSAAQLYSENEDSARASVN